MGTGRRAKHKLGAICLEVQVCFRNNGLTLNSFPKPLTHSQATVRSTATLTPSPPLPPVLKAKAFQKRRLSAAAVTG